MKDNSAKNNFIMQAGILAAAGIVSRIIGLLYRSPLQRVIGNEGMGYYHAAYAFYTIVLLISSYSIPLALSKIITSSYKYIYLGFKKSTGPNITELVPT